MPHVSIQSPGRQKEADRSGLNSVVRVAAYTRWPSADKDHVLRSHVASQPGWQTIMRVTDHGSGTTLHRPGLQRLLKAARIGLIDVVLVCRLDSLSRKARHLDYLLKELDAHDVTIHSAIDRINTSTPTGKLLAQVVHTFASYEAEAALENHRHARTKLRSSVSGDSSVGHNAGR